jgi:signal transduction histidine kinase
LNSVKKYLQEIDAIKLITEIIEMQLQINKNSVNINFYSDLPNLIMLTDKTMIYQIINNLIENSIKYSGGNKNIDVFIELINFTEFNGFNRNVKFNEDINEDINEDTNEVIYKNNRKYLRFIVKDYGIGISKENIEKISEPFFRGENVNEIRGLGLGLSISKTWVKILEGSLIFESEEGKYTVATLELPIFYPKEIS